MRHLTNIKTLTLTLILTAATFLPAAAQTTPTIRRVTLTGDATADGSTWPDVMTLQAALASTLVANDQIWIQAGTYKPVTPADATATAEERAMTFTIPAGVLVYGGFLGNEPDDFDLTTDRMGGETILSGDLLDNDPARGTANYEAMRNDNSLSVVTIGGNGVTLNGLTIQGGQGGADVPEPMGPLTFKHGAGLYSAFSNTTLVSCTFRSNDVTAVGIGRGGGAHFNGAATLTSCTFTDNRAEEDGGAIYTNGSFTITLTDCTFTNNTASKTGGAVNLSNPSILTNCTFTGNRATFSGGAANLSASTLTGCVFTGNNHSTTSGGAVSFNGAATLTNCVVAGNRANNNGGGVWFGRGATVINSTFYNNTAGANGGGMYMSDHANSVTLQNNILIGNSAATGDQGDQVFVSNLNAARAITLQNNLVTGGADPMGTDQGVVYQNTPSANVTETDPVTAADAGTVFASIMASDDDYLRLKAGSPAVNAGNNDYVDNASPAITTDLTGAMRIQGGTVDLGAYESDIKVAQTIDFTLVAVGAVNDEITLAATGGASGLPVSFQITAELLTDGSAAAMGAVATLTDKTLNLTGAGMVTITASQSGNDTYAAATAMQTITVRTPGILRVTITGDATADGSTWTDVMTLQAALGGTLLSGDQIWIQAGTYKPHATNRSARFTIPAGVRVYGGFVGNEAADFDLATTARTGAATILSGDLGGNDEMGTRTDNSTTVVRVNGADVVLNGLTISGGHGAFGAGLLSTGANTAVTACTFTNNTAADDGGGAYFVAAGVTLTDCAFTGNEAMLTGGGAYFSATGTTLTGVTFTGNTATNHGGGAYFDEAATLQNCVFANNTATTLTGGGLSLIDGGTVINSTLYDNTATNNNGGGIYVRYTAGGDFNLQNSLLLGNTAMDDASGHQLYINNTDAANVAALQHNLFESSTGIVYATPGAAGITEANTVDPTDADAVFASTMASDNDYLRLKEGSPAVNAGNNDYVNNASPAITTDLAGAMRIQIGTVDLGAYESTFKTAQTIDFTLVATAPAGDAIDLAATGGASGLPVSFASSDETVAAIGTGDDAGKLLLKTAGMATITAMQNGNDTYAPATAVMQTIEVIAPTIRRVVVSSTATTQDGTTWENAMTLQDALAITTFVPGDQLWIKAGTYKPHATDKTVSFTIPAGVRVYGGFVGDEADDFNPVTTARTGQATILSGDLSENDDETDATTRSENSTTVVTVTGVNVVLDGLTITAGEGTNGAGLSSTGANTAVTNCTFTNNTGDFGGGAYFTGAESTLTNCAFNENTASLQGGGAFFNAITTVTSCTFTSNTARLSGGGAYFNAIATVTNCTFTSNTGNNGGGGGAYFLGAGATLTGCTFAGNMTSTRGGGALFFQPATLTNCTFMGNRANGSNGGGALFDDTATLTNVVVADNRATGNGGGLWFNSGGSTVINTTLYKNTATINGGGIYLAYNRGGDFNLQNSLLLGNTAMDDASGHQLYINNTDATNDRASLQHNLIAGGADPMGTDQGVVYLDPDATGITEANTVDQAGTADEAAAAVFESTATDNDDYLRLKAGSPAISAGNNDFLNNGTPDNTEDDVTTDLAGNVRIQGGTVDLGAYESDTKLAQAIMFMLATPGTVGEKPDLIATSDASLEVTFASSDEAVAAIGTGADAGKLVLKIAGMATITASQSGNDTYAAATAMQTIMVEAAGSQAQAITFMLAGTGTVNDKIDLSATTDSGLEVTFASSDEAVAVIGTGADAGKLVLLAIGTTIITASQAGNATYAPVTPVTQMITVEAPGSQAQAITFSLPMTGTVGDVVPLTATANSGLEVTFASSNEAVASIGTGADAGKLVLKTTGTTTITASQAGNATYAPATPVTQMITVEAPGTTSQTITFTLAGTGTVGEKIDLNAMSDSNLPVRYASSDEAVAAIGTGADAGKLVLLAAGTATITASQPGNPTYAAATPVTQSITVSKRAQTITFTLATTGMVNDKPALTATATSTLPVTFTSSDDMVAAIGTGADAGMLVLKAPGSATITASQSGDDMYAAAPPVTQVIMVEAAILGLEETADGFALFPNPTSGKLHFSEQVAEFRLYGIEGRLLETRKNVRSADLSARPAGLYFVEVVRGERSLRWRVVRE